MTFQYKYDSFNHLVTLLNLGITFDRILDGAAEDFAHYGSVSSSSLFF